MAYGLPVEGEAGPFAGSAVVDPATCGPDERASTVAERLGAAGAGRAVVVNDERIVLGLVGRDALEEGPAEAVVAALMEVIPSTVRASVPVADLAGADEPALVTDSSGRLLGVFDAGAEGQGTDEGTEEGDELQSLQGSFLEVVHAAEEHFGDREPSEEEMRDFLHQRLVDQGRSPEEADAYLEAMDKDGA